MVLNLVTNFKFLSVPDALTKIKELVPPIKETETISLDLGMGRVLSEDIFSPIPLPPFKSSAMDGFALRRSDWNDNPNKTFNLAGVSLAGHPIYNLIKQGECVRIFTGAKVPDGCDQIILQEEMEFTEEDYRSPIPEKYRWKAWAQAAAEAKQKKQSPHQKKKNDRTKKKTKKWRQRADRGILNGTHAPTRRFGRYSECTP